MLKKLVILSLLPLSTLVACDDDGNCTGHICGGPVSLMDNEGGGVVMEYVYNDLALQSVGAPETLARTTAWFTNHSSPEINPQPGPGVCTNLIDTNSWPVYIGRPAEYLKSGTLNILGKNGADADIIMPLADMGAGRDPFTRAHDQYYLNLTPGVETLMKPNSFYTVEFGGDGVFEKTTYPDSIFLAENFEVLDPPFNPQNGNQPIDTTQDLTVTWRPATSSNLPAGATVLGATWLVMPTGLPTHMCPTLHSEGKFTIPAQAFAEHKAIRKRLDTEDDVSVMILLRNAIVHRLAVLPNGDEGNKRRLDMVSAMCWAQLMPIKP